ncbi:MAG: Rho termination factor N-terminal domain-containing protein, partial [Protaetiibacter sp.]
MTDTTIPADAAGDRAALSRLRLPELQALAAARGISGVSQMRKGDLVDTLSELPGDAGEPVTEQPAEQAEAPVEEAVEAPAEETAPADEPAAAEPAVEEAAPAPEDAPQ